MAVGKSIWKKSSIQWLDNAIKKAKDMINKDKEVTLEDVATDIDNWTAETIVPPTTSVVTPQIETPIIQQRTEPIITPTQTQEAVTTETPSVTIPTRTTPIIENIQVEPEKTLEQVAQEWETQKTGWIPTQYDINLLKRTAEQHWVDPNDIFTYARENPEELRKWWDEINTIAKNLNEIEEPWLISSVLKYGENKIGGWVASAKQDTDTDRFLRNLVWADNWLQPKMWSRTFKIDMWDWTFKYTDEDSFLDSIDEFYEQMQNKWSWGWWWEDSDTDIRWWKFYYWANYSPRSQISWWFTWKELTMEEALALWAIRKEAYADINKKEELTEERRQQYRKLLWLKEGETIEEVDWRYRVVNTGEQTREEEMSEVTNTSVRDAVQKYWLTDNRYNELNSAQQMLTQQEIFKQVQEATQDNYSYIAQIDREIERFRNGTYHIASSSDRQKTIATLEEIRWLMKKDADDNINRRAQATAIMARYASDDDDIIRELRKEWLIWDDVWDYAVLSEFLMGWIDEQNKWPWYDVANRMHDQMAYYLKQVDDIIHDTWNESTLERMWHETQYGVLDKLWEMAESLISKPVGWAADLTVQDAWVYAAGETQMWVFNEWYELASDVERFTEQVMWKTPEVAAFFLWWDISALWKATRLENFLWKSQRINKIINGFKNSFWLNKTLQTIQKLWNSAEDIAKAEKLLTTAIARDRTYQKIWRIAKEVVENFYQDWAFFNRWDTEYMTQNQDTWTMYWWLFAFANMWLLKLTRWSLQNLYNVSIDKLSRTVYDATSRFNGSEVMKSLSDFASKGIGRWDLLMWTKVDINKYFKNNPNLLVWAMLQSIWMDTSSFIEALKNVSGSDISGVADTIRTLWNSIFEQSQEAARVLNKLKSADRTWLIAVWEKQYVAAMLSTFLKWQNSVNAQEIARMINDAWYTVPDMIKRFYNTPGNMLYNWGNSRLYLQIDANKMHQVDHPRELDFIDRNGDSFQPAKAWTKEDMLYAYNKLDSLWTGIKEVFDENNVWTYFTKMEDWTYVLNKQWLESLWYRNNKLIPEVVAQVSENTEDFVSKLREINESNGVEVLSEKLISDIEQTDAYDRLSSQLWDFLC